ncbi:MAG: sigma-70 family RNA polymerase sigma factor [Roseburia sp.]|nr:sigma-70 family RNA polymerase sigma factor [Roseburia sp.]MCM1277977.1 sigma-70 family RNA polymerase sigma factor [Robinsoniella sp.]
MTDTQFWECMEQMRQGEKEALKAVYEAYMPYLYSYVLQMIKSRENAEDIISDFFLKLWGLADDYEPKKGHKSWLIQIVRNMTIDFIRKHKKEALTDFSAEDSYEEERGYGKTAQAMTKDGGQENQEEQIVSRLSFQEALSSLKESEQQIIHLKIAGELTFKEIGELLQMPMGTVTWKYQNAIKKLRRCGYYE